VISGEKYNRRSKMWKFSIWGCTGSFQKI